MALDWRRQCSASTVASPMWRILLLCLVCVVLIVAVHFLSARFVMKKKVSANQIVSPWDKSQIPPVLRRSHVVPTTQTVESKAGAKEKEQRSKHRSGRRHSWRRR